LSRRSERKSAETALTTRRLREPLLLAAALAAPLLPPPLSFLLLLAAALLWLGLRPRPPRREAAVAALLVAVAAIALAGAAAAALGSRLADRRWIEWQAPEYRRVWEGLRDEAATAAGALKRRPASPLDILDHPPEAPPPATVAGGTPAMDHAPGGSAGAPPAAAAVRRLVGTPGGAVGAVAMAGTPGRAQAPTLEAFDRLARLTPPAGGRRRALMLIDRDGNAVAWAGEGLVHEPDQWPRSGLSYRAGFNSVTFYAAEPLDDSSRPWRVVAGESFATDRLPRAAATARGWAALAPAALAQRLRAGLDRLAGALLAPRPVLWSVVDNPAQAHPAAVEVRLAGAPALEVERLSTAAVPAVPAWPAKLAWAGLAAALLALGVMRGVGLALPAAAAATLSGSQERGVRVPVLILAGLLALAMVAEVPPLPLAAMEIGVGLALLSLAAAPFRAAGRRGHISGYPPRFHRGAPAPKVEAGQRPAVNGSAREPRAAQPPAAEARAGKDPDAETSAAGSPATETPAATRAARAGRADAGAAWVMAAGAAAVLLLFAAAWVAQLAGGPFDAAEGLMVPAADWCIRLAWSGGAFGLLNLAARRESAGAAPAGDPWIWLATGLLLAGAALSNLTWAALPALAAGGACAARFADRRRRGQGTVLAAMTVVAALAGAAVWETAYRARLATYDATELLGRLAPPAPRELAALEREVAGHFARLDLEALVARSPVGLDRKDLAYALWRGSPLARPNALSAVVVRSGTALVSSFSFGVPLTREGEIDRERLGGLRLPGWEPIAGEAVLRQADGRPGLVRFWLLPRPGFRLLDRRRLVRIEVGLLRGNSTPAQVEELAAPGLFALYTAPDGRAALSPWVERPPLAAALRRPRAVTAVVDTPSGRARAYARPLPGAAAWEAVYLPDESPLEAIERTANWAVGLLLLLACAAPPAALLALPRSSFRDLLRRTVRSYSRRLLIVYTALLLLPLVLLNALLVRSVELDMLNHQATAGQAALAAAEALLGEEIRSLPVGFVFDPGTFDPKLTAISELVRRPVNLYGRSRLSASSEHELFTAGLLPTRLPGVVYSSLALRDRNLYSLTNRVAEVRYLELYAPLRLAGDDPGGEPRLFVSVPLLAQQVEGERQLAHLRRHAILVTAALFVLLAAVGTRLAQNFTRPITQLVEGTRRIAAGARSLDLAPTELELAALVAAVDDMARRIAEGREGLLREKQVVERVVQNIASGVVSLDRERRVLMHNRVAAELLGVAVGQSLERVVARSERLAPVAAFLRAAGGEMARATVRLGGTAAGEREWSLVWVPLPGQGEPFALLVVEDATEELRGQRLLAWAAMARMIAHEIKNPLTPIRLSAEHMREIYHRDPEHFAGVFERCTANILAQVEELRSIASEFSTYSAIPRIDPRPGDLTAAVSELVEGYRAAPPRGVSVELETPSGAIPARFDAKLLPRAVRNLIENALRASAGGGRVVVRVERDAGGSSARVAVLDSGPGVPPELLARIFDPYFSTHDTGTGLGLPIARRIAEEHGGSIAARNRPEGGLEAVITIPCAPPAAPAAVARASAPAGAA
jgi:signal transduction histidine kinase